MAPPHPSIQSFFPCPPSQTVPSSSQVFGSSARPEHADGFTDEEAQLSFPVPPSDQWRPRQEYEETAIGDLEPCPAFVTFSGRIVNLYDMVRPSKRPVAAKGCLKLMVADDTGAVTVRVWYGDFSYQVRLGQLVTVWTVHISQGEQASLAPAAAPLFTTIFPERESSAHLGIYESGDDGTLHKKPFGCEDSEPLAGLLTLQSFTDGGHDVDDCKLLVCVKSIGARKTVTTKNGFSSELVTMRVFDDTAEASLTLCGVACRSTPFFQPSHTVLLITNPGWTLGRTMNLKVNENTRIDIDPDMGDARWLRSLAQRITKREHVNPPFPVGIFNTEAAETASLRILYNLGDIDEYARLNRDERFMGYINVLITQFDLVVNKKRNMLMCSECCGVPIFDNKATSTCERCKKEVPLRINPRIVGPIMDETGEVVSGKLIFTDKAWGLLLGRAPEQLLKETIDTLQYMEHRMRFLRVTLGFGWCLEGSKPLPGGIDLKRYGRKRKRLAVFDQKDKKKVKTGKETEQAKPQGEAAEGDGLSEMGRLCIWTVKK